MDMYRLKVCFNNSTKYIYMYNVYNLFITKKIFATKNMETFIIYTFVDKYK